MIDELVIAPTTRELARAQVDAAIRGPFGRVYPNIAMAAAIDADATRAGSESGVNSEALMLFIMISRAWKASVLP